MFSELTAGIKSIINFLSNPVKHWQNSIDNKRELFIISFLIVLTTALGHFILNRLSRGFQIADLVYFLGSVLISLLLAWLLLNVYARLFNFYVTEVMESKIVFDSNLLFNQRIAVYASTTMLLSLLPIGFSYYLMILAESVLMGYGISTLYRSELGKSLFYSAIFVVVWKLSIKLLVNAVWY